jgi:hypothetical protein
MKTNATDDLKREEKLILIWIRDAIGPKKARLKQIRRLLKGDCPEG